MLFFVYLLFFLILFLYEYQKKNSIPLYIFSFLGFLAFYFFRALTIQIFWKENINFLSMLGINTRIIFTELMTIFSIGILLFFFGYKFAITLFKQLNFSLPFPNFKIKPKKIFYISFLFFCLWFILVLYKWHIGALHYGGRFSVEKRTMNPFFVKLNLLSSFFSLSFPAMVYVYFKYLQNSVYIKKLFYFAVILYALNIITSPGVLPIIHSFLLILIIVLYPSEFCLPSIFRIKLSRIFFFSILGTILLFLGFLNKSITRAAYIAGVSPLTLLWNYFDYLPYISFKDVFISAMQRFHGIDSLAVIKNLIDLGYKDYLNGKTFMLIPIAFVPRILYLNKPEISLGMYFNEEWFKYFLNVPHGVQGTAFFIPGEFYMNFGVLGLLFGMFVYGFIVGTMWYLILNAKNKMSAFMLAVSYFPYFIIFEFSLASYISGYIKMWLLITAYISILKFLNRIKI